MKSEFHFEIEVRFWNRNSISKWKPQKCSVYLSYVHIMAQMEHCSFCNMEGEIWQNVFWSLENFRMCQISKLHLNNFHELVGIIKKGCTVYLKRLFFTFWCEELSSYFSVLQDWGSGVMILENKEILGKGGMERVEAMQNLLILYWISWACMRWIVLYQPLLSTSL